MMNWHGVMPAITTPFQSDLSIDFPFLRRHLSWLVDHGSTGIVALGSLGEGATLSFEEKVQILKACVEEVGARIPVVAGISALSTAEAVDLAKQAKKVGCQGLMVLPPYVYRGDWRENKFHFESVISATELSCMLYNNPIAYGVDVQPDQVAELTKHQNLHSIKESSGDIRRLMAIRALIGDRLKLFVGIDDVIVEGIAAGATGWIAGLVNACPAESVRLYNLAMAGNKAEADRLYAAFLPLLRLDTVGKFVQLIKLVQSELGMGSETVRPPRLPIAEPERSEIVKLIHASVDAIKQV